MCGDWRGFRRWTNQKKKDDWEHAHHNDMHRHPLHSSIQYAICSLQHYLFCHTRLLNVIWYKLRLVMTGVFVKKFCLDYSCILVFQLQIYICTCIVFVATALFKYCYIVAMLRFSGAEIGEDSEDRQTKKRKIVEKKLATTTSIDIHCLVLFNTLFAVFNLIYFAKII